MYLDDTTVGGSVEEVLHDLEVIKDAEVLVLSLNNSKSEIICHYHEARGTVISALPGATMVSWKGLVCWDHSCKIMFVLMLA